ncbi:MAG: EF2563 family selenium-dependent molybdenum hydroxylase system protein [Anaerolineae bacterium]|nr:EF2563 family selenium-dependent molybdenum hydroxylase system protein [Anaerolineae bacterium]
MASAFFSRALIVVRGGGDLASGVVYRLCRAGFPVIITELAAPVLVRRTVSFGEAVYSGEIVVEGLRAQLAPDVQAARGLAETGVIAVLVDPAGENLIALRPAAVVDARMVKFNLDTTLEDAPLVVALGPGFSAGVDCHAVIETNRGHNLGRVIYAGPAEADTGEPGVVQGHTHSRVLRAPAAGHVRGAASIGDVVESGQVVAWVSDHAIRAAFTGVLRGLVHERVAVEAGMKIGDLDPRAGRDACFTISDKSLAVGGGVLEAVLAAPQIRPYLMPYEAAKSL